MYPDWATKYKRPGTILRKKNDNSYLLFSAHSERQKGKKYPVLVQEELIGTITKDGISYNITRNVDITNIIIISFSSTEIYKTIDVIDQNEFKDVLLLKIKNKYFFSCLSEKQINILKKYNINYLEGIKGEYENFRLF